MDDDTSNLQDKLLGELLSQFRDSHPHTFILPIIFSMELTVPLSWNTKSRGGDDGIRTHDPLLAGQVLSQLSYTPIKMVCSFSFFQDAGTVLSVPLSCVGVELFSRTVSRKVSSPLQSLTSVFGMGTGGPSAFVALTFSRLYSLNIEQHLFL